MKNIEDKLKELGISLPEVLLPADGTDLSRWAVIACDQYTSQPDYWNRVESLTEGVPSSFHMILPEIYLEHSDKDERMAKIQNHMKDYLDRGLLSQKAQGIIYIDRKTSKAPSRKGLILAVDLERYDYKAGSQSLIRATEGTVVDRLPPRIKIRENALLELPHIMLLIDDPDKTVIEPVAAKADSLDKLYDFELMLGGGHIKAFGVNDPGMLSGVVEALEKLAQPEAFRKKYGVGNDKGVLLFAAGDGNHSLAAAKAFWEELKQKLPAEEAKGHPSRYALVEIVNVHDAGLVFEPIHRVLFNVDAVETVEAFSNYCRSLGCAANVTIFRDKESMLEARQSAGNDIGIHLLPFTSGSLYGIIRVENPKYNLEVGTLQAYLDVLVHQQKNVRIDYIHGEEVVSEIGSKSGNMGFYLPAMDKRDLFRTVILDGVLPRKTFSMGEAEEKRYYLECRKIR